MEILIFLLLAGLWAAFLLPPFFASRRDAPISSTQRFDRSLSRLASMQGFDNGRGPLTRHQVLARRRRVFVVLTSAAALTLALALWRRSLNMLFLHLVIDALAVGYVAMLLEIKQRRAVRPPSFELGQVGRLGEVPADDEELQRVRVVSG